MAATTIELFPLERRKVLKKFVQAMIGWTLLFLAALVGAALASSLAAVISFSLFVALAFALLAAWQYWYENKYFEEYFYDAQEDFLVLRKGVITPRETVLPYEKFQDVYVDQDVFDRLFNLYDVHVSTATALSGWEAHIDGVNKENAGKLRELVLKKIREKRR